MDTIRKTLIAVSLVLIPAAANAAGLGKLTVFSGLGQPFRAAIELVSVSKEELLTLSARLAPPAAFNQANIEYSSALLSIKFTVDKRAEGQPQTLVLSSTNAINEPFLDMLVELNWAAGRLVREYTLLLDPPGYQGASSVAQAATGATLVAPTAPQTSGLPAMVAPAPVPAAPSADMRKTETRAPAIVEEKPLGKAPQKALATYEVRRGDTLRKVADQNKPQGVSVEQMLVALYRGNREAFDGNNMNRLRTGAILRIPEREDAAATEETDSRRLVSAQAVDFNAYRRRLAGAVEAAPAAKATDVAQSAKGKITAKIEDTAAPAKPGQDQLRLSSADDKAKAGGAAAGKAAKEDDLAARNNAVKEANARVADLEKTTKDLQKLLEIKNQQLADLQAKAGVKPADTKAVEAKPVETKAAAIPVETKAAPAPAKPEEPKAPAVVPAKAAPVPAKPEEPKTPAVVPAGAKADAKPGDVNPAEMKAETKPADAKPVEAKADAKPAGAKPVVKKAPPPEPDLMDRLLGEPLYLAGLAAVLLAAIGAGVFAYRRRKSISKFEDSIITGGDLKANSVFANTGGQSVDTGGSSLQSIVSVSGGGAVDSDEVDPIAEADVYMAYGRDSQAEEILKEALAKDPGRQAIRAKLLEIYFARKDVRTFETIAGELYAATGGSGTEWSKAVELGVQLDPSNTLYGGRAPSRVISPEDTVILPGPMPTDTIVLGGGAPEAPATAGRAEEIIDLSAPPESAGAAQAEAPAGMDLDFNLDLGDAATKEPPDLALEAAPAAESGAVDFDLGGTPTAALKAAPAPEGGTVDFDLGGTPTATLEAAPAAEGGAVDFDLGGAPSAATVETSAINFEAPAAVDVEFDPASTIAMTDATYRAAIGAPPETPGNLEIPASAPGSAPKLPSDAILLDESTEDAYDRTILVNFGTPGEAPPAQAAARGDGADGAHDARWQEVTTKLDLAKAYEEMGDKDGTRELLNEVLKEGDNAQQDQARSILARLG